MAEENQQRRVKATGEATHRKGTLRGAVKPHKRVTEPDLKQVINTYMDGLGAGSVSQTMWGTKVDKNAQALRSIYGLAADDEPYLLLDITTVGANYSSAYFSGAAQMGASMYAYGSNSGVENFIPKTMFVYGNCLAPTNGSPPNQVI